MADITGIRYVVTNGYPWLEFYNDLVPNEFGAPFIRQFNKPDGTEWESVEEVTAYAEELMEEWRNATPTPRPVVEE